MLVKFSFFSRLNFRAQQLNFSTQLVSVRDFAVHVLTFRILEIILLKPKNFLTFHFNVSTYATQSLNLVFVPSYKI